MELTWSELWCGGALWSASLVFVMGQIMKLPDINIRLSREGTQPHLFVRGPEKEGSMNFPQFHQLQLPLGEVRGGQEFGKMGYEKRPGRIQGN